MAFFKRKMREQEAAAADSDMLAGVDVDETIDAEEVMRKYDKESNTRIWEGIPAVIVTTLMVVFSVYCLFMTLFSTEQAEARLARFLAFVIVIGFMMYPARKSNHKVNHIPWYDFVLMAIGFGSFMYFAFNVTDILLMGARIEPFHVVLGIAGLLVLVELCRRCVGLPIIIVVVCLVVYALYWQFDSSNNPTIYDSVRKVVQKLFYTTSGVIGTPINVCYTYIVLFVIFGAFLERTGIANFFIALANKVAGWSSGGAAKVAVISSALCGMVSGSSVGNVVTTGSVTIPMMKKVGYKPEFAGGVEAAASSGGQIMPPIMGAGAFIMAEIIGVQYAQIAAAAVLPAVAYFLAVFILVHMIAKKKGLGKDSGVHYEGKPILPRVYRLLPIVVLVVMIIMGYSLPRSAIYCTIFSIIIAAISPETRMSPRKLLQTLMDGVRQAANIAIPTAACGIMIGIVVNSGVAVKIAKLIGTSGEGSLFIALLIAALGCLLLGMALPTVAAYLIAVTLFASAIQGLGISALVTNMFIFYFGVVAQITPPVCLASFTAAGIAGASAWKTGWKAFSFAITAFIVPFAFVYRPAILLEGTAVEIIIAYCIVIAATYLLACGIAGYLFRPLKMWERIACYIVAFIFILPSSMSDIIGIAGCVLIMAYCFMTGKKNANKAQPA